MPPLGPAAPPDSSSLREPVLEFGSDDALVMYTVRLVGREPHDRGPHDRRVEQAPTDLVRDVVGDHSGTGRTAVVTKPSREVNN